MSIEVRKLERVRCLPEAAIRVEAFGEVFYGQAEMRGNADQIAQELAKSVMKGMANYIAKKACTALVCEQGLIERPEDLCE